MEKIFLTKSGEKRNRVEVDEAMAKDIKETDDFILDYNDRKLRGMLTKEEIELDKQINEDFDKIVALMGE